MSIEESERLAAIDGAEAALAMSREPPMQDGITVERARFAASALRLRPGSRLLLLGAGASRAEAPALGNKALVVALDVSPPLLAALSAGAGWLPVAASVRALPLGGGAFDAALQFGPLAALTAEIDAEAAAALLELRRVLRTGARLLCGAEEGKRSRPAGRSLSPDRRRVDEWRREAGTIEHHTVRIMRADGTWQRLHERRRRRSYAETEALLNRSGFAVLNAFREFRHSRPDPDPIETPILLCAAT